MSIIQSRYSIWLKTIAMGVVCLFLVNDFSFAVSPASAQSDRAALAPPLATNPPCFIANGIEYPYDLFNELRRRHKFLQATGDDKIRVALKTVDDGLKLAIDVPFSRVYDELLANAYDATVDRITPDSSEHARINSQLYIDGEDIVLAVTDNGKTVEFHTDEKTPLRKPREFGKHIGGVGGGGRARYPAYSAVCCENGRYGCVASVENRHTSRSSNSHIQRRVDSPATQRQVSHYYQ